jgi:hypothetical protein
MMRPVPKRPDTPSTLARGGWTGWMPEHAPSSKRTADKEARFFHRVPLRSARVRKSALGKVSIILSFHFLPAESAEEAAERGTTFPDQRLD